MREFEYVVADPILGDISCDGFKHASHVAELHGWKVFCIVWQDGEIIDRYEMEKF